MMPFVDGLGVRATLLATLLVFLGGCVSGHSPVMDPMRPLAQVDDDRGAIEGIVTDDSLLGLSGVMLTLDGDSSTAVSSGPDGRFAFSFVMPGRHVLMSSAVGFVNGSVEVSVEAGKVASADLRLLPLPAEVPYHVSAIVGGSLGCSVAVYVAPADRWQPANVCGIPGYEDEYLVSTPIQGADVRRLHTILFETVWTSTQVLGSGLNVRTSFESDEGTDVFGSPFWDMRGGSPLRMALDRTIVEELGAAEPSFFEACVGPSCHFELATYPWPDTLGPAAPVDVGLNLEQRFTHYVSEFYDIAAPSDFSATPDS